MDINTALECNSNIALVMIGMCIEHSTDEEMVEKFKLYRDRVIENMELAKASDELDKSKRAITVLSDALSKLTDGTEDRVRDIAIEALCVSDDILETQ